MVRTYGRVFIQHTFSNFLLHFSNYYTRPKISYKYYYSNTVKPQLWAAEVGKLPIQGQPMQLST